MLMRKRLGTSACMRAAGFFAAAFLLAAFFGAAFFAAGFFAAVRLAGAFFAGFFAFFRFVAMSHLVVNTESCRTIRAIRARDRAVGGRSSRCGCGPAALRAGDPTSGAP